MEERSALITGAASGIGLAIARCLHGAGYRVVLTDIDGEGAERAAGLLGEGAEARAMDVSKEADWAETMRALQHEGVTLDVLVNNAGVGTMASIEDTTLAGWDRIVRINQTGVFLGCRTAVQHLRRGEDSAIINISSALGKRALASTSAYSATKAAVLSLTESTALHCATAGYGIRCNAVLPGFVETPLLTQSIASAENPAALASYFDSLHPVGHIGSSSDVAEAVRYLASPEARFVTGACLCVDGGMTI